MFELEDGQSLKTGYMLKAVSMAMGMILLAPPVLSAAEERLELQTYEVTGTRIPRADIEGVAPIVLFDREALERSGAATDVPLLR